MQTRRSVLSGAAIASVSLASNAVGIAVAAAQSAGGRGDEDIARDEEFRRVVASAYLLDERWRAKDILTL